MSMSLFYPVSNEHFAKRYFLSIKVCFIFEHISSYCAFVFPSPFQISILLFYTVSSELFYLYKNCFFLFMHLLTQQLLTCIWVFKVTLTSCKAFQIFSHTPRLGKHSLRIKIS